jgi:predicted metal-binding membrane protein
LLDPTMASASQVFGGIVLIAGGVYQWTPLKDICLAQRQSPLCSFSGKAGSIAIHRAHCCLVYVMALIALAAVGH